MKTKSLISKILLFAFAAMVINQMACSNASFEKAEETKAQRAPAPDNPDDGFFDEADTGDAVSCDRSSDLFCDPGDDGLTDDVPDLSWNLPDCDVVNRGNGCYTNVCHDTRRNPIKGVDVWLVVDSSRSFDDERVAVGKALAEGFIRDLVEEVPVNISVIAGHAPSGPYGGVASSAPHMNPGVFYRHGSEPVTVTIRNTSEIASKKNQLLTKLRESMRESPISRAKRARRSVEVLPGQWEGWSLAGPHSGSDELGLRNFLDAINGRNRAYVPRNNGWVVLFMSDENDACTPFTENGYYVYSHPTDESEMRRWYCSGVNTSKVYAEAVRFAGARPFALGAMVYRNSRTIPSNAHAQASIGKGYLELVAKAGGNGVSVDLASAVDSWSLDSTADRVVGELARITNKSVGVHTKYGIQSNYFDKRLSLNRVATKNGVIDLQVYVDGKRSKSRYTIDSKNSLIQLSEPGEREVRINFCLK